MDALHDALNSMGAFLDPKENSRLAVLSILRRHFQVVLGGLNNTNNTRGVPAIFDELNKDTPGRRQVRFMKIHFNEIRPEFVEQIRSQTGFEEKDAWAKTIWCALVFRVLCWLSLHDFHPKDVQLPKRELLNSRLPVYLVQ
ncbi:hypothetical protein F5Y15DRAFT_25126 [Xylariaceae sp. FL0016]|nr:hypothetical protein F5Y15DRAFT_25126 [Xylariaceae sp. FL0016]